MQEIQYKPQIRIAEEDVQKARELFEKNNLDYSNLEFYYLNENLGSIFIQAYQTYNGIYAVDRFMAWFDSATGKLNEKPLSKLMGKPDVDLTPTISLEQAFDAFVKTMKKESRTRTYAFYARLQIEDNSGDYRAPRKDKLVWRFMTPSGRPPYGEVDAHTGQVLYFWDGIIDDPF